MKKIAGWKSGLFIGSLAGIAMLFYVPEQNRHSTEPRYVTHEDQPAHMQETPLRVQEIKIGAKKVEPQSTDGNLSGEFVPAPTSNPRIDEVAQKLELGRIAEEKRKREHEEFIARNINPGFGKGPVPTYAVIGASSRGTLNPTMASIVTRSLARDGVSLASSLFTPEFVSDGNFKALADGSDQLILSLQLTKIVDGLVLASEDVAFSTTPALENLITASLHLEVSIIEFANHNQRRTFSWNSSGPGFRENDALKVAEERIVQQIARDTNFYLNPINRTL